MARNIKENRKRCGISQAKLAEKANISTQYIAMIEVSRKFPTPEVLDRIANAFEIDTHELFVVKPSPEERLDRIYDYFITNIEKVVSEAVEKAIENKYKKEN